MEMHCGGSDYCGCGGVAVVAAADGAWRGCEGGRAYVCACNERMTWGRWMSKDVTQADVEAHAAPKAFF